MKTLDYLLSLDGEQFVRHAYALILGRVPDPEGLRFYCRKLWMGSEKFEILSDIYRSPERLERKSSGVLNSEIEEYIQSEKAWIRIFLRYLRRFEYTQRMKRIESRLFEMHEEMQSRLLEVRSSTASLNQLISRVESAAKDNAKRISQAKISEKYDPNAIEINRHLDEPAAASHRPASLIVDSAWYIEENPDIERMGMSAEEHFLAVGKKQCRIPFFDSEWYLAEYPDVALAGVDPYEHYKLHGKREGRYPAFNSFWYLAEYPDIVLAGVDPYIHYKEYGRVEGRYPAFDRHWYLEEYKDVAAAGMDPYEHYTTYGKLEGRFPGRGKQREGARSYLAWIEEFDTISASARRGMVEQIGKFGNKPIVSIIVPVYNPNPTWLAQAIESVRSQIYENWELCIANDASPDPAVRLLLDSYAAKDKRIKVAHRPVNGHISNASNTALELATGSWIALLDHDDLLSDHSLFWVVDAINRHPKASLFYSDEDNISEDGERSNPYFKSDWNPDLFYSQNLFGHLGVYKASLVSAVGGFRVGMEGSQDYDLALRCMEKLGDESEIQHIPRVLYHWRIHEQSTAFSSDAKPYAMIAGERAINEHFTRTGVDASVSLVGYAYRAKYALPANPPLVSIIIPTRNGYNLLKQCIDSIISLTEYKNYEIIVVDNGSDEPRTIEYLRSEQTAGRIRVIRDDGPFNYSALNNGAVEQANGELIGLVNNDIEVVSQDWLTELVSHALRPEIGAVGARLLYPNNTLQHGGVILGIGGAAGHAHKGLPRDSYGYFNRARVIQNYSAVTAACLVVRKSVYLEVGGLDAENFSVAYNDVDFCLKVRAAGYRNLWNPYAELYHHESATRGHETTPEKKARLKSEMDFLKKKWGDLLTSDPAYSPNLSLESEDFALAWPPRVASYAQFVAPYESEFQDNSDFSGFTTDIKAIAFYLPQFHVCEQNSRWWGEGFTEWTNTKKALPRFDDHYQPREPHADIGYYDLSDAETLKAQAKLARAHGIHGFCFYHYWFSGERVLETPLDLLLAHPEIDMKFCVSWANENWTKTWDGMNSDVLMEQKYLPEDPVRFIRDLERYLKDSRYICIDGKPLILVYKPQAIPNVEKVFAEWRMWWREHNGSDLVIWATRTNAQDPAANGLAKLVDGVVEFPPAIAPYSIDKKSLGFEVNGGFHDYEKMASDIIGDESPYDIPRRNFYRSVMLGWDNSARRKEGWSVWYGFSLRKYYEWVRKTVEYTRANFSEDKRFMFINAWNEWAEGTYLEPDKKFGYASINTTSKAIFGLPFSDVNVKKVGNHLSGPTASVEAISGRSKPVALVIHAFYLDVFSAMLADLAAVNSSDIVIYVSCPAALKSDIDTLLGASGFSYEVMPVANHGRDILPFLKLMRLVVEAGHEFFIKVHTKKTLHRSDGEAWRKELFDQLVGTSALASLTDAFRRNPKLGILGPAGHVISIKDYMGSNKDKVQEICKRLGLDLSVIDDTNFVAGTMFAARVNAVVPLLNLKLSDLEFDEEKGQDDGTLAHAVERAFALSAVAAGLTVSSTTMAATRDYGYAKRTVY